MIDRLPKRLHPQRRYLTFVVGLLAATFVLTAVLAYRAHRSELDLRRLGEERIASAASLAAEAWSTALQIFAGNELISVAKALNTAGATRPEQAWSVMEAQLAAMGGGICHDCATRKQVLGFFAIDRAGVVQRRGAPLPDDVIRRIRMDASTGRIAVLGDAWLGSMYFQTHRGTPHAVAAFSRLDVRGELQMVYGFEIPQQVVREFIRIAFASVQRPPLSEPSDATNESIFAIQALTGDVALYPSVAAVHPASDLPSEIINGLELRVGVRPEAKHLLVVQHQKGRFAVLLALLVLIAALIIFSVVLVRKEAELVRLRADFISSVSHELRTPLAQIRMFTETLLLGRVRSDLDRRRSLEIIDQEARRLTNLIENVLTFSKSEGGHPPKLSAEPTTFAAQVRAAVESFGPLSRLKDVEIRSELQQNIAAPVDRSALRQILVNLIDNALKYGPKGQRITVGVALFGDKARLWVDDEGPGVPLVERERVFDSFVRLKRDVEAHTGGSGIGLAVVRELARLHGGNAWVEAAPGTGARFLVEFPDAYLHTELSAADLAAAS